MLVKNSSFIYFQVILKFLLTKFKMNQQLNRRFSQFENVKFFYDFYLKRINWLCENFFNRKICEFIIF